jgi:hypothetical protein
VWSVVGCAVFFVSSASSVIVSVVLLLLTSSAPLQLPPAKAELSPMSMEGIEEAVLSRRSLPWARATVRRRVWFRWQLFG